MKSILTLALAFMVIASTNLKAQTKPEASGDGIKWVSLTEAEAINAKAKHKKKIMVDVYTDWCGWCKRLDASTYKDPNVVKYVNDNYLAVKLNAESKDTILFKGTKHSYNPARRTNTVAAYFMPPSGGGYPTITYLDEKFKVVRIAPGYVNADDMLKALRFVGDNYYLNTTYEKYQSDPAAPEKSK